MFPLHFRYIRHAMPQLFPGGNPLDGNRSRIAAASIILAALLSCPLPAFAVTTYYVNDHASLAAAITDSDPNKEIVVTDSFTMTNWIYISSGKHITIRSDADGPYTISKGSIAGPIFMLNDYIYNDISLTLEDIILDGDKENHPDSTSPLIQSDGAILTIGPGAVLQNNYNGSSGNYSAGGIVMDRGTLNLQGGVIKDNDSAHLGGGIFVGRGTLNFSSGLVSGNTALNGGGMMISGTLNMTGGEVSGNTAEKGGGISIDNSEDDSSQISGGKSPATPPPVPGAEAGF